MFRTKERRKKALADGKVKARPSPLPLSQREGNPAGPSAKAQG